MIAYFTESTLSLIFLFGLYWLFLRKEKAFVFNRFFLLFSVILSLIIPFISITIYLGNEIPFSTPIDFTDREIAITEFIQKTMSYQTDNEQSFIPAESSTSWLQLFIKLVYFSGFFVFLMRFLLGLFRLSQQVRQSHKIILNDHKIILIRNNSDPYCFFDYIFIREEDYNSAENGIQLIKHELVHVKQYHSVDIVIIELVKVLFWFNPVFILFDRAIRINHEYLADRYVVEKAVDAGTYAGRLLKFASDKSQISFTSGASN